MKQQRVLTLVEQRTNVPASIVAQALDDQANAIIAAHNHAWSRVYIAGTSLCVTVTPEADQIVTGTITLEIHRRAVINR
ncbi:MAG: hypothetical protein EOM24_00935 [Chloroflexia bacterium]|nr:hypothetical protein [Chloroflexia bacterium]